MFEKPKRKRGEKSWKLSLLLTTTIILAATLYSFSNSDFIQPKAYATEAWIDPAMICSTAWYAAPPEWYEALETAFREEVTALDWPIQLNTVHGLTTYGQCAFGESRAYFTGFEFNFIVSSELIDEEISGNMISELVQAFETVEGEFKMFDITVIDFHFSYLEQNLQQHWYLGYSEAKRAVAAGLRGADLWAIGQ